MTTQAKAWTAAFSKDPRRHGQPDRFAYIYAESEDQAAEIAANHMGQAQRVDLQRVILSANFTPVAGTIVWVE